MSVLLPLTTTIFAIPATLASLYFLLQCLLGRQPIAERGDASQGQSLAILMPAHNEVGVIEKTLPPLLEQLTPEDRLLVVADNCSDDTAGVARSHGVEVIERNDLAHVGKGYALAFGVAHLNASPPEALVCVDADCEVSDVRALADLAVALDRPVQGCYTLTASEGASAIEKLSVFAFFVKNCVRARALQRMGAPGSIAGTGFALPWRLHSFLQPSGSLVEDAELSAELMAKGEGVWFTESVRITSPSTKRKDAVLQQRTRWEAGRLRSMRSMVAAAMQAPRKDVPHLAAALDILVPPLALLLAVQTALLVPAFVSYQSLGAFYPFAWVILGLAAVAVGTLLCVGAAGQSYIRLHDFLAIPKYALGKMPIYFDVLRGKTSAWERSERSDG
ncbi:MAG: glycosyltransferase family 2 protein [Pseudomonadota bacterium]